MTNRFALRLELESEIQLSSDVLDKFFSTLIRHSAKKFPGSFELDRFAMKPHDPYFAFSNLTIVADESKSDEFIEEAALSIVGLFRELAEAHNIMAFAGEPNELAPATLIR